MVTRLLNIISVESVEGADIVGFHHVYAECLPVVLDLAATFALILAQVPHVFCQKLVRDRPRGLNLFSSVSNVGISLTN